MVSVIANSVALSRPFKLSAQKAPFIPFSELQRIKQLEFRLIDELEGCNSVAHLKKIHASLVRKCLHESSFMIAKLLRTMSKLNVTMNTYGVSVFSQVRYPNAFLYTAMIRGYLIDGIVHESVSVYKSMRKEGLTPLSFTFCALLKASASNANVDFGRQLHAESLKLGGFSEDMLVSNVLIDMYLNCGRLDWGRKVFDEMPDRDMISWTTLINAYAKAGDMDSASELFSRLPVKDVVAWTAMVTGFVQNAKPKEALEYFEAMQNAGVQVDEVTLVGIINACSQLGSAKYADWVLKLVENSPFSPETDVHLGSALIDMYSKCGSIEEAYKVFNSMQEKNVYAYSSMISALAIHGSANAAIELFEEMVTTSDVKPNLVTFMAVLTACSHGGLVSKGQHFFNTMESSHGIKACIDHYTCMADLLSRSGQLQEALDLIKSMPMEPNAGIWGAILGACRKHLDPDVAEVAARHLFELEPWNVGNYILLADIYAKAERWEDVLNVKKLMKQKGLRKSPGFSWVEGENGAIHRFYAGDTSHPRSYQIKETLENLVDKLKIDGYKPDMSCVVHDISDEEKRKILMNHSEKLALAYVLVTSEDGCVIRIVKNLRICEDCHLFMCCVSKLTSRKIVVRDNMRFHHFLDGSCSCSNFW